MEIPKTSKLIKVVIGFIVVIILGIVFAEFVSGEKIFEELIKEFKPIAPGTIIGLILYTALICLVIKKKKQNQQDLRLTGKKILADFVSIQRTVEAGGDGSWNIVCEYTDEQTNLKTRFISNSLSEDPTPYFKFGKEYKITVFIDENSGLYLVDTFSILGQ